MFSVFLLALFFAFVRAMSKTTFGSCILLALFVYLGAGMIWNARANQHVLKFGQRTTAPVIYHTGGTSMKGPLTGRFIKYRYPEAGHGNPLHLFNVFFRNESEPGDVGTAIQVFDWRGKGWHRLKTVTIAYLPENPRAHVVIEDCSTEAFYVCALLCLSACVWVVLHLICLNRVESSITTPPLAL